MCTLARSPCLGNEAIREDRKILTALPLARTYNSQPDSLDSSSQGIARVLYMHIFGLHYYMVCDRSDGKSAVVSRTSPYLKVRRWSSCLRNEARKDYKITVLATTR